MFKKIANGYHEEVPSMTSRDMRHGLKKGLIRDRRRINRTAKRREAAQHFRDQS